MRRVGIKYCGGCNPRFERVALIEKVREHFQGKIEFESAKEGQMYDGLLVVGGCSNCCPSYEHFETETEPILIWDQEHYETLIAKINKLI